MPRIMNAVNCPVERRIPIDILCIDMWLFVQDGFKYFGCGDSGDVQCRLTELVFNGYIGSLLKQEIDHFELWFRGASTNLAS